MWISRPPIGVGREKKWHETGTIAILGKPTHISVSKSLWLQHDIPKLRHLVCKVQLTGDSHCLRWYGRSHFTPLVWLMPSYHVSLVWDTSKYLFFLLIIFMVRIFCQGPYHSPHLTEYCADISSLGIQLEVVKVAHSLANWLCQSF